MVRKLGTWLLGVAAFAQTSCYQHHTADEELLGLPPGPDAAVAVTDAGAGTPAADAGVRGDGGTGCPGTDAITQLACSFLGGDAGAAAGNINDLINSLGGLGALTGLLGGGTGTPGRDAGSSDGGLVTGAQCQNATDALSQFFCGLQGGGGTNLFGRRDGGFPTMMQNPMMQNPPPAQPADAGVATAEDAGLPVPDAAVEDAAAVP